MRFDIIITNYNYARFLGAAIDSALAQIHPQVRVIVVDDGSTDESESLIAAYGERIVTVFKENGGQGSAVNAGFAIAEGDAVMFLDSDDILDPGLATRVAEALHTHPDAAKVQWRMELADANGRPTGTPMPARHLPLPEGDMRRAELTFPFDIAWSAMSGNAFPSAILRQILPMPAADYRTAADSYLQHLTPLLGPIVSLDFVGTIRRVHGSNSREQLATAELELRNVHKAIRTDSVTRVHLERLASHLGLTRPTGSILSVADLGNRLISLRLDPAAHPLPGDHRWRLTIDGTRAAMRRFDVRPSMRAAFGAWFVATALAPRPVARRLGQWFLFPEQRSAVNRVLRRLHRGHGHGDAG